MEQFDKTAHSLKNVGKIVSRTDSRQQEKYNLQEFLSSSNRHFLIITFIDVQYFSTKVEVLDSDWPLLGNQHEYALLNSKNRIARSQFSHRTCVKINISIKRLHTHVVNKFLNLLSDLLSEYPTYYKWRNLANKSILQHFCLPSDSNQGLQCGLYLGRSGFRCSGLNIFNCSKLNLFNLTIILANRCRYLRMNIQ